MQRAVREIAEEHMVRFPEAIHARPKAALADAPSAHRRRLPWHRLRRSPAGRGIAGRAHRERAEVDRGKHRDGFFRFDGTVARCINAGPDLKGIRSTAWRRQVRGVSVCAHDRQGLEAL